MVAVTRLAAVLITDTLPETCVDDVGRVPWGLTATADGSRPTGMVAVTRLVVVSITDTLSEPALVT